MKRFVFVAALVALMATPSFAALPPGYERLVELRAVLDAIQPIIEEIGEITAVELIAVDLFEVRSDRCSIAAQIVDTPIQGGFVGPRQFTVVLGKMICAAT